MTSTDTDRTPLLLHACCGPCSLMPVERLREAGFEPAIFYCNPNIAPAEEYTHRLETLKGWAAGEGITVLEAPADHDRWEAAAAQPYREAKASGVDEATARERRCRACYRLRFEETAKAARAAHILWMSTTLSVSPYQYIEGIADELRQAADAEGIGAHFEDFRPYYAAATEKAKKLGLYRQNYCGCELSAAEAAAERAERKAERERLRQERKVAEAPRREAEARARAARAEKRRAYDEKRAHQREVLRTLRGLR